MKGHFVDHLQAVVLIAGEGSQVWGVVEGEEGERAVLTYEEFLEEGTFVGRGCGYWRGAYERNRKWLVGVEEGEWE